MKALVTTPQNLLFTTTLLNLSHVFALGHFADPNTEAGRVYTQLLRAYNEVFQTYTILDNGVMETGKPLEMHILLDRAKATRASEIVLPDTFNDNKATKEQVRNACHVWKNSIKEANLRCMAVLHTKSIATGLATLREWAGYDMITAIGLPKVLSESLRREGGRIAMLRAMVKEEWQDCFEIHLLGVWEDISEVFRISQEFSNVVRSIDTSWPLLAAIDDMPIDIFPTQKPHFRGICSEPVSMPLLLHNFRTYAAWAGGEL